MLEEALMVMGGTASHVINVDSKPDGSNESISKLAYQQNKKTGYLGKKSASSITTP